MKTVPLRLALSGCGRAAERLHLPAIRRARDVRLAAVVDPAEARRAEIASQFAGCVPHADLGEVAREGSVDGIIVATPVERHFEDAALVLAAGIPALMEKPLGPSHAGVEVFGPEAGAAGGWLMLAFHRRHWGAARRLREALARSATRDEARVEMLLRTDREAWGAFADRADALDDLGCHQLDLLRFLLEDEIATVSASWSDRGEIAMRVAMRRGGVARCTAGHGPIFAERIDVGLPDESYTIHAGSKYVSRRRGAEKSRTLATLTDRALGVLRGRPSAYDIQLDAFCGAIRARRPGSPDLRDGLAALHAARAARASAESGGIEVVVERG